MRLLELNLDRYGPFSGDKLVFDEAARLHVIYGPNEAGKSSALAAIGDLFYGAPRGETFLRPKELSLGALLRRRDGEILRFSRRKGLKNTLLDAKGAALPDDALASFLGGTSREIFSRAFGLNAQDLRAGGAEMLKSGGEIGAALFAAASGLRGLIALRDGFAQQADAIFGERRAGYRAFYQALDRFNAAKKDEKDGLVSESRLKELDAAIALASERIAILEEASKSEGREKLGLERMRRAAPLLRELSLLRDEAVGFGDLDRAPAEATARLGALLAARDAAGDKAEKARQTLEAAREELEKTGVDEGLLARAEEIEKLIRASGAAERSTVDLASREKQYREICDDLLIMVRAAGFDHFDGLHAPDAASLLRAEQLIARGQALAAQKPQLEQRLRDEQNRLDDYAPPHAEVEHSAAALADMLAALGNVEALAADVDERAAAYEQGRRALDENRARLAPALPDLELFARSATPDAATIADFVAEDEEIAKGASEAARHWREGQAAQAKAQQKLADVERAGAVARRADLDAARAQRDEALTLLRDQAEMAGRREAAIARLADGIAAADELADRLFAQAGRVIAAETAREDILAAQAQCDAARRDMANNESRRQQWTARWIEAWREAGIIAAAPRRMAVWRAQADQLLKDREALLKIGDQLKAQRSRLEQKHPGLIMLRDQCGLNPLPLETAALARWIAGRIDDLARAEEEAREARARLADAPRRIEKARADLEELAQQEGAWRKEWSAALATLGLRPEADGAEAQQRIAFWRSLPARRDRESEMRERIGKIRDDIHNFEQRLDALLADCACDIPARPVDRAVRDLSARLRDARQAETLRRRAEDSVKQSAAEALEAAAEATRLEQEAQDRALEGGAQESVEDFHARLLRRDALRATIVIKLGELARVADGHGEAELRRELEAFEPDAASLRLGEIDAHIEARDLEIREIHAERSRKISEREALEASGGAEAAIFAREGARDEMTELAHSYVTLKCAALLVDAGLSRQRDRRRDPLLARAGDLFATLTDGRYRGLDQAFGDDDQLRLRARRVDEAALELSALSEGAQDQLYLALRLAFLEEHAARAESPPFIGDDIFASFDNSRVAAGLRALAGAGEMIQPILFTHHRHIVELATATVGAKVQILALELS